MATKMKDKKELTQREVASMGGRAAARKLGPTARRERAQKAAAARWSTRRRKGGKK